MRAWRSGIVLGVVAVAVIASARLSLRAQDQGDPNVLAEPTKRPGAKEDPGGAGQARTVQDALERPFIWPFAEPTRLDDVCRHLRRILRAPVVLDRAALDRQDVRSDDTIELDLHGVRLKTGLKLLLDQVGLTYRVVPEDNLLILTDQEGSDDPLNRVFAELKAIHRDIHDVQDAVDEVRAILGVPDEGGAKVRKPTIIEEMPEKVEEKKVEPASPPVRRRSG